MDTDQSCGKCDRDRSCTWDDARRLAGRRGRARTDICRHSGTFRARRTSGIILSCSATSHDCGLRPVCGRAMAAEAE